MGMLIAGLLGGLVGAGAWAAIGYFTGYEVGWIAWGVGVLAGAGTRAGAGGEEGSGPGLVAAFAAIASIVAGKYLLVHLLFANPIEVFSDELLVSYIADEVAAERIAAGEPVDWPAGVDPATAAEESDYPKDVWAEAKRRWDGLSEQERSAFREAQVAAFESAMSEGGGAIREMAFRESFGMFDLLWFALAAGTAFRIGAGES